MACTRGAPMDPFTRRLLAASGYLDLGLPEEAWAELETLNPPERRTEVPVLALRVAILHALQRWKPAAELCCHLASVQPEEPGWLVSWAYATRRAESLAAARDILLRAQARFPGEAVIPFNLACYAAQSGEPAAAKNYLRRAFALDEDYRGKAAVDPDLAPIRSSLDEL